MEILVLQPQMSRKTYCKNFLFFSVKSHHTFSHISQVTLLKIGAHSKVLVTQKGALIMTQVIHTFYI